MGVLYKLATAKEPIKTLKELIRNDINLGNNVLPVCNGRTNYTIDAKTIIEIKGEIEND